MNKSSAEVKNFSEMAHSGNGEGTQRETPRPAAGTSHEGLAAAKLTAQAESEGSRALSPTNQQGGDLDLDGLVGRLRGLAAEREADDDLSWLIVKQAADALLSQARLLEERTRERDEAQRFVAGSSGKK